jgi:hypothetical protein
MIGGLHWTAWLLLIVAVVPAVVLVTTFHVKHRRIRGGS